MTAIKPERFDAERREADISGPERFAPNRRPPEKLGDLDKAVSAFEGEIREFVRRDVAVPRRPSNDAEPALSEPVAENLNALVRRISGASMEEIDRVILELQGVRDMLRQEGNRVSREVAGYASLSHAAMTAMKVIADRLTHWKNVPPQAGQPEWKPGDRHNAG
jgi:hypothetical protein